MQKFWLSIFITLPILFFSFNTYASSDLNVSQVSQVAQNIALATQIGQTGVENISNLTDLEKLSGNISVTTFDMSDTSSNTSGTTVLQSVAFGGYTFISNVYDSSKTVSSNIVSALYNLEVNPSGSLLGDFYIGLFGFDNQGNFVNNLSNPNLSSFKLFIFDSKGILTTSKALSLDRYFSQQQAKFIIPNFSTALSTSKSSSAAVTNLPFEINGVSVSSLNYPYLVHVLNSSDIDIPNRFMSFQEIYDNFYGKATLNEIGFAYKNFESIEFALGSSVFSFNKNSFNQSTNVGPNGIVKDISSIIAPYIEQSFQLLLIGVDTDGNIITSFEGQVNVSHYLLSVYDSKQNLITSIYVDPSYSTSASKFGISQSENQLTIKLNGRTLNKTNPYTYPIRIDLSYNSGVRLQPLSSISNKIILKASDTLTTLSYVVTSSSGSVEIPFAQTNFLDSVQVFLDEGKTILINMNQALYSEKSPQGLPQYEITFTAYSLGKTEADSFEIIQNAFLVESELTAIQINYAFNNSATQKQFTVSSQKIDNNWLAIISSGKKTSSGVVSYDQLSKLSNYESMKALLSSNNIMVNASLATSSESKKGIIPGWYDLSMKQFQGSGFSLQLNQMQNGDGYYFVQDYMHNKITSKYNGATKAGVAALDGSSSLLASLKSTIVPGGTCTFMFLCFDQNHNYIVDISKTNSDASKNPYYFALFMFDNNGQLLGSTYFSVDDYVGLGNYALQAGAKAPITFTLTGLGLEQSKTMSYPFSVNVDWNIKGKVKPTPPTPSKPVVPTIPSIPDAVIALVTGETLKLLGYMIKESGSFNTAIPAPLKFSENFMNEINSNLKKTGNYLWINLVNNKGNVSATIYSSTKEKLTTSSATLPSGATLTDQLYYSTGKSSEVEVSKNSNLDNLWIKIINSPSVFSYSELSGYTLAQLQTTLKLNGNSINMVSMDGLETFNLNYNLNAAGPIIGQGGYAFLKDPWSSSTNNFNFATGTGIAATLKGAGKTTTDWSSGTKFAKGEIYPASIILLAFDENDMYVPDLTKAIVKQMALLVFDNNKNLMYNTGLFSAANIGGNKNANKLPTFADNFWSTGFTSSDGTSSIGARNPEYPFVLNMVRKYVYNG